MTAIAVPERTCRQAGCPFPEVGQCLEGFEDVAECPNTVMVDEDAYEDLDSRQGMDDKEDEESSSPGSDPSFAERMLDLGGAVALSIEEASELVARNSGLVVLIAGPVGSGKTTLVVELYARFLYGPFANTVFGGSETLKAFDFRHFPALEPSGSASPTTDRTQDEDMRLLHLRLRRSGGDHHLLFSDVRGEVFENLVDGSSVAREMPIGPRVDRCLLVVDGQKAADPRQRDVVFTDARQLAGGLRAEGGLAAETPIAVLCSKWDLVPEVRRAAVLDQAAKLAAFAAPGDEQSRVMTLSVRPGPPESQITGLTELLDWLIASGDASA